MTTATNQLSTIAVVGAGYVGSTAAACFAELGHRVHVYDVDETRVAAINNGVAPVHEARLPDLIRAHVASGTLTATTNPAEALQGASFLVMCVPTPSLPDGSADLSALTQASTTLGPLLKPGTVVMNKSTVPVGSTTVVADAIARDDVVVVSNPEFLREGSAVADFLHPDRVVIGCDDPEVADRVADLYRPLGQVEFVITDPASAELIKYASNAYLATRLSFINAVAEVCEALGGNMPDVGRGIGLDSRIGSKFLQPGPGWGGSCFPKDTRALVTMAERAGFEFRFLDAVILANEHQFDLMASRALEMIQGIDSPRIVALGLTFKAGTDDVRNSPALEVVRRLVSAAVEVAVHDPQARGVPDELERVEDLYAAAARADLLLVLTEWPEFKTLDASALGSVMRTAQILDTRTVIDVNAFVDAGFRVRQIGRREIASTEAN